MKRGKRIGTLKRAMGYQGYKTRKPGASVYEEEDRYVVYFLPKTKGAAVFRAAYYKDTLAPDIAFIPKRLNR